MNAGFCPNVCSHQRYQLDNGGMTNIRGNRDTRNLNQSSQNFPTRTERFHVLQLSSRWVSPMYDAVHPRSTLISCPPLSLGGADNILSLIGSPDGVEVTRQRTNVACDPYKRGTASSSLIKSRPKDAHGWATRPEERASEWFIYHWRLSAIEHRADGPVPTEERRSGWKDFYWWMEHPTGTLTPKPTTTGMSAEQFSDNCETGIHLSTCTQRTKCEETEDWKL